MSALQLVLVHSTPAQTSMNATVLAKIACKLMSVPHPLHLQLWQPPTTGPKVPTPHNSKSHKMLVQEPGAVLHQAQATLGNILRQVIPQWKIPSFETILAHAQEVRAVRSPCAPIYKRKVQANLQSS